MAWVNHCTRNGWCLDCDYFWTGLSGFLHICVGGRVDRSVRWGQFGIDGSITPAVAEWYIGAYIVIISMFISLNLGLLIHVSVEDVLTHHMSIGLRPSE